MLYNFIGNEITQKELPSKPLSDLLEDVPYIKDNGKQIRRGFLDEFLCGIDTVYEYPGILKIGTGELYDYTANGVHYPAVRTNNTRRFVYTEFGNREYLTGVRYELMDGKCGIMIPDEASKVKILISPYDIRMSGFVMQYNENVDNYTLLNSLSLSSQYAEIELLSGTKRELLLNIQSGSAGTSTSFALDRMIISFE